jgi:hypothetical protein
MPLFELPATEQEVFDIVAKHLLTQNRQSLITDDFVDETCAYRGRYNTKCAAGILIPDEYYTQELEGNGWRKLVENSLVPPNFMDLIAGLQFIHDMHKPIRWKEKLEELAKTHKLEWKFSNDTL